MDERICEMNLRLRKDLVRWQINPGSKIIPEAIGEIFSEASATGMPLHMETTTNRPVIDVQPTKKGETRILVKPVQGGILYLSKDLSFEIPRDRIVKLEIR